MAHLRSLLFACLVSGLCLPAWAGSTGLADWCFNINGNWNSAGGACNAGGSGFGPGSTFDTTLEPGTNSLGSAVFSIGAGQAADAYMDYDLDYLSFGSFQDSGAVNGGAPTGVTWELGDPNVTNIFNDFASDALADTNGVGTPGGPPNVCCDVAWALGVDNPFATTAYVTFTVSAAPPPSTFYLQQTNFDLGDSIYLSYSISPVPEDSTLGLVLCGCVILSVAWLFKWRKGHRPSAGLLPSDL